MATQNRAESQPRTSTDLSVNHNQDTNPKNRYGLTEVAPKPYNETPAPENRYYATPRPEAWKPGLPTYPWWKIGGQPEPVTGVRLCETYLLAWIKEITRAHADDWLTLSEKYESKIVECNRLQKAIASHDYEASRRTA